MFSQVGSESYFGVPDLSASFGYGYQEDEDDEQNMDIEDAGEEGEGGGVELISFLEAQPLLEDNGQGRVRWMADAVPPSVVSVAPHVMNALSAYTDEMSKHKAAIMLHPCLPMIVHSSPMVSLISGVAVVPPGQEKQKQLPRPWHPRYTSFVYSAYQLHQLYLLAKHGCFPFPSEFTQERQRQICSNHQRQIEMAEELQNSRLDALYRRAVAEGNDAKDAVMHEFIALMESYCHHYLHIYEYTLHALLVEPRCQLALEHVLTPSNMSPSLDMCLPEVRERVLEDCNTFFNHKIQTRVEQEAEILKRGEQLVDARPLVQMPVNSARQPCPPHLLFRGYLPLRTIYEYFWFLDADGVLSKAQWSWEP